jgi:hypothetical protein
MLSQEPDKTYSAQSTPEPPHPYTETLNTAASPTFRAHSGQPPPRPPPTAHTRYSTGGPPLQGARGGEGGGSMPGASPVVQISFAGGPSHAGAGRRGVQVTLPKGKSAGWMGPGGLLLPGVDPGTGSRGGRHRGGWGGTIPFYTGGPQPVPGHTVAASGPEINQPGTPLAARWAPARPSESSQVRGGALFRPATHRVDRNRAPPGVFEKFGVQWQGRGRIFAARRILIARAPRPRGRSKFGVACRGHYSRRKGF